ncbi:MAG TPA: glycine cleavage system protein GcvH [Thermoplasmata archaeon]|nr:glycine cleavage system protein GcvH [Thermoplasmata archaeon]
MSERSPPSELRYTKSHEWLRTEGAELVVGITDHAQQELTDIVFVELPKVGTELKGGGLALVLESVKTVADVYAPSHGAIVAVNEALKAHPELVNRSPYGEGWLFRQSVTPSSEMVATLSAEEYAAFVAASAH